MSELCMLAVCRLREMVFLLLSDVRFFHIGDEVRVRLEAEFNVDQFGSGTTLDYLVVFEV